VIAAFVERPFSDGRGGDITCDRNEEEERATHA
jgi:hypothetical protein